jgi:hypothetical protein
MKRRSRLTLLAAVLAVLAVVIAASFVRAGTQGGCSDKLAGSLQMWENAWGDTSDGDDNLWMLCSPSNVPRANADFRDWPHTLPGLCKANYKIGDNWNDCISSYWVNLPSSLWVLCLYQDVQYGGLYLVQHGPYVGRANLNTEVWKDSLSSYWLDNDGTCGS